MPLLLQALSKHGCFDVNKFWTNSRRDGRPYRMLLRLYDEQPPRSLLVFPSTCDLECVDFAAQVKPLSSLRN